MKQILAATLFLLIGMQVSLAQHPKIGTFDSRAVALAFYRSEYWAEHLKSKVAERNREKAAGNQARVTELEAWSKHQQELAHQQVFDGAPVSNVLDHIRSSWPEIARTAGVNAIVSEIHYIGSPAATVDLTMQIVDWLKSSAQPRAMVKDVLENGPGARGAHKQ